MNVICIYYVANNTVSTIIRSIVVIINVNIIKRHYPETVILLEALYKVKQTGATSEVTETEIHGNLDIMIFQEGNLPTSDSQEIQHISSLKPAIHYCIFC